jgi:hypothetical protein
MSFVVGRALGRSGVGAALAVIDLTDDSRLEVGRLERRGVEPCPALVTHLETLIPQLPKKDQLSHVSLAIDATEVGRPIVEMIRHAKTGANVHSVTVTGGDSVLEEDHQIRLPERDLVVNVKVLVQAGRLQIAGARG